MNTPHFKITITLILLITTFVSNCQSFKVDSILNKANILVYEKGNFDGAIDVITAGIDYFSNNGQIESKIHLEMEKIFFFQRYVGPDSSEVMIDQILKEYKLGERKILQYKGLFLMNKADILYSSRRNKEAIVIIKKAIPYLSLVDSSLQIFNKKRSNYLSYAYERIGSNYSNLNQLDSSMVYNKQALKYSKPTDMGYIYSLANIARIYSQLNKCDSSIAYSYAVEKNMINITHHDQKVALYTQLTATSMFCKAHKETIRYSDSALVYIDQLKTQFVRGSGVHQFSASAHLSLGNIKSAYEDCAKAIPIRKSHIILQTSLLSISKKIYFLNRISKTLDVSLGTILASNNAFPNFNKQVFEYAIFLKNYPLYSLDLLQNKMTSTNTNNPSHVKLYNSWLQARNEYHGSVRFSDKNDKQLNLLRWKVDSIQQDLNRKANISTKAEDYYKVYFNTIASSLKGNEMAIEFIRYQDNTSRKYSYGAFLTKQNSQFPEFIFICEEDSLKKTCKRKPMESDYKYIDRVYESDQLYCLIWQKIFDQNKIISKVYVSLSGHLNYLNHGALKMTNGVRLLDEKEITVVNSTKDILQNNDNVSFSKIMLFGGIHYDSDNETLERTDGNNSIYQTNRGEIEGNWTYLPGTKKEVEGIHKILKKPSIVKIYTALKASETNFRKEIATHTPTVIHIATHNLYIDNKKGNELDLNTNSYLRSGLILAGANTCHSEKRNFREYGDGVLTAPEVALLDLRGTDLVVLSACESGIGNYTNLGNNQGLQQAFKTAGAKKIIYSLWKISDDATEEFMLSFYRKLNEGTNTETAFTFAQETLKLKYGIFYWGAFQLMN